jgi:excisionase family DNA binding protein
VLSADPPTDHRASWENITVRPPTTSRSRSTRPTAGRPTNIGASIAPLLLAPEQAAETLSISRATLYALLSDGAIQSFRIGKRRVIPVTALEAYIARELESEGA